MILHPHDILLSDEIDKAWTLKATKISTYLKKNFPKLREQDITDEMIEVFENGDAEIFVIVQPKGYSKKRFSLPIPKNHFTIVNLN